MEKGATALVTGGSKRIGKAIVEDLARNGFALAIHCNHSRAEAEELAAAIVQAGAKAAVVEADLTDRGSMEALVGKAAAALGPVRLLVNNASLFEDDEAERFDWDVWDRHFAVHLEAPVMLARQMAAELPKDMGGLVVNIVDQRVLRLNPRFFSYTLSKSALWTATRTLAQALAPRIRVNAIGPGPTLANDRQDERDFRRQVDALLLRRQADLTEFGAAICFLWESPSMTGQMLALDGGQHLGWETPDVAGIRE